MKSNIINPFTRLGAALREAWVLPALLAVLNLIPAGRVTAQTFTTLHGFTATTSSGPPYYSATNSDGAQPWGELITNSSGNTLFGTAKFGGSSGDGSVFAVNTDGTGFTNLYSFSANTGPGYTDYTNSDGAYPVGGLVLSGNTLYGTARAGGTTKDGTVFALNTDGTGFTNLHTFIGSDGANPEAGLILSGNSLYGTTLGSSGYGTVFAVNTDGAGFTNLHSFTATSGPSPATNSDGAGPNGLILSGNTLYGTASSGGGGGGGTVFAVNTNGTGFTNLHSFPASSTNSSGVYTNSDGAGPRAGLVLANNTLSGTAYVGGSSGNGTVFAVNTNGKGFTNLHSFTAIDQTYHTNSDGAHPEAGLILSGNTLYGTAVQGGNSRYGTVFAVNTNGKGFTNLHSFTATHTNTSGVFTNSDGVGPQGLILSGHTLYGTALNGGSEGGQGTVFSLSFRPQLTITPSGAFLIFSWPSSVAGFDYTGYTLQSGYAITGTYFGVPGATSPYTTPKTAAQEFFRLISN